MNNNRSTVRARTNQRNPDEELVREMEEGFLCLPYTYIVRTWPDIEVVDFNDPSKMHILHTSHSWHPSHEHK